VPRSGAVTLSDLIAPTLTLVCGPCERKERYSVAGLMAKHGDARLTDLRRFLTADCAKHNDFQGMSRCNAIFDPPPETRRERPTW
jgi:hypothetical protein